MRRIASLVLLLAAASLAQDTRVVLLGTGTPNPEPDRMGPAVAVISGKRVYLIDCGPGVVRRASQAGIGMAQITRAFVTHLHSDHTVGLPDLIFTPAVTGRQEALEIYGPPGLRAMTGHVMKAYSEDQQIRLHGLEPSVPQGYVVHAHDVKPGEIYRDEAVRVIAFGVSHGTWKYAYGYRFEAPDKIIVISGDTTYSPALVAAAKGCDILVHEVYSAKGLETRTPEWRNYHAAFHTSGTDLGRVAAQVRPKTLVLYHQLAMGQTAEEIVGEIRSQFDGNVVFGKDLDIIR
ncbi:MAG TPA: MBL fold metallo-hydrolase [Candidatus Sulfopaludibacter sp.]|jgi:ribonuclease Z|nr:MBL fold metallo-hydrolase [Candidatus Sulfopaludibacter sp.]